MAVGRLETEGHQPENGFVSCEATSAGTLSRIDCSVLPFLGGFGKYQKQLIVLTWIPALFIGFSQFSDYFLLALPNITCVQPTNASNLTGISYSLFNSSTSLPVPDISANDTIIASNKNSSIQCMCKELKYELETGLKHNVVTKWNLVCDSASKVHIAKFSLLVGSIFGYLVMGVLADWFGRHPVLLTSVFFMLVFGLAVAFSVDVTMFSTLRFFEGFCLAGISLSLYVLRIELCLPRYRFSMTMVASFVMLGGQLLMPGLAALCRDWKVLQVVIVCPLILMLFYTWVFPESLRWLLATQQYWRSKALMYRIAKKNRVDMEAGESEVLAELQTVLQNKPKKTCIVKMVGTRNLWKNIVVLCVNSLTGYGIHHCFARSLRDPEANETTEFHSFYADYYTMAGIAVSACVALCPAVVLLGRRGGLLMFMIITALASLLQLGLLNLLGKYSLHLNIERSDTLNKNFSMAFSVIGMFSSHAVSNLSIFFCAEVTPTAIRGGGLGLVLASAGFGMLTAPIMELHNQKGYFLHHIIFACCTLICIICILLLPEPRDQPLPEAIADGENYTRQPLLPARRPGEQRRLLSRSQSREYTPLHQIATSAASTSVTDSASRPPPVADSAEDSAVPHSTESITLLTTASVISTRDPTLPHSTDSTVPVAIDSTIPPTTESVTPVAAEQSVPSPTGSIVPIAVEPIPATIDSVAPVVVEPVPSNTGSVAPIVIEPVPPTTSSIVPIDVEQIPSTTCSIVPNVVETSPSTTDSIAPIVVEPVPTTTSSIVTDVEPVPYITGAIAPIIAEPIPPTTGPTAPMVVDSINPPTTNSTTLPPTVSAVTPIRDSISFPTTDSTSMGTVEDSSASPTTEDSIPMTTDSTVLLTTDSVNFIPTDAIGTPVTDLVFLPAKDLPFPVPKDSIAPCDINLVASPVTDAIVSPTIESSSPAPSGSSVLCLSDSATPTAAKDSVVQPANGSAAPLAGSYCGGPLATDYTMSPTTDVISPSCTEDSTEPSVKDTVSAEISPSNTVKS